MSSRHELREMGMRSLYQSFLLNKDIKQCVYDNCGTNEIDSFLYTITIDAMKYKDIYIEKINHSLTQDWEFKRLGYVEQAILILACCELDLDVSPRAIVIDEAVTLAKKYCDEETYKLINGVLDHL
ncbi:MAG: transcription antitermination protein NusB [Erysipelotrichaceae bacterium]|nr:transcription antitermination protein NusB [Erysipelotrichaceae bacterium]